MKDFLGRVRVEHFLWGVVLARVALVRDYQAWDAVVLGTWLLLKPSFDTAVAEFVGRRHAVEKKLADLEAKIGDVQNRTASLALAAGIKRQGP